MRPRRFLVAFLGLLLPLLAVGQARAQQYFGRNKVQYRSFDFKVIRTEHFDVYFYPQEREAALDAARMAERSYARLSRVLQHEFRERKPIILYASHAEFQQTNAIPSFIDESTGGVTEPLKNRVIVPFTGDYADFEHVLTHELVHAFQFDILMRRGMPDTSPMVGRLPLWYMEGMAEYLSIGRIDPQTVSWLRDAVLSGYIRDIAQMNRADDYLSYRFGQSLWEYIGRKWGDEVIGIILQKTPRIGIERAFRTTLGLSLGDLSAEWMTSLRKTYLPQVADYQRPDVFAEKLTHHDRLEDPWYVAPALAPDGRTMVYVSQRGGFSFDLWLADPHTGEPLHRLVTAERNGGLESLRFMSSSAAFSPDSRFVAFAAQTGGRDALYIYDIAHDRIIRKLRFRLNGIAHPSWSPRGDRIVFSGNDGGITDLFITDLDGRLKRLTDDRYADLTPSWAPDGSAIAFSTDRGPGADFDRLRYGNLRVALYYPATGEIEVLPHQERGKNLNPVWAPDSRSLAWVGDRTGNDNLYLFDLASAALSRVSNVLSGVIAVTPLSPVLSWGAGGRLLFVYFERAGYNIYAVDDPRALPRFPVDSTGPALLAAGPGHAAGDGGAAGSPATAAAASPAAGSASAVPLDPGAVRAAPGEVPMHLVLPFDSTALDGMAPATPIDRLSASWYHGKDGFRPSSETPPSLAAAGGAGERPVSVLALMDSVSTTLPDTTTFRIRPYKVKFTADMIGRPTVGAQVGGYYGNGLYGGSYIALSDILGNQNILVAGNVNGSFSDAQFFAGYAFLKKRANLTATLEQIPLYRYYGGGYLTVDNAGQPRDAVANVFLRDVIRAAALNVSYPFSAFRRLELGLTGMYYKSDILYRGYYPDNGEILNRTDRLDQMSFAQPMAALVFDNTLFGWTGPIYGHRYRLQLSRTFGDFAYTEALADVRNYFNIKRSVVFASQLFTLSRFGSDADRFLLFWGGPYFIRGYDGGSFDPTSKECADSQSFGDVGSASPCPVRDQLIGSSAALMNLELRFPIIKELDIGPIGSFPPVDLVTFFDGGVAWSDRVCLQVDYTLGSQCVSGQDHPVHIVWDRKSGQDPLYWREPLFSWGLGLRFNIFYTVLRLDYAFPLDRPDRHGIFSLSFGPSF